MNFPQIDEYGLRAQPVFPPYVSIDWKGAFCDHCWCEHANKSRLNFGYTDEEGDHDQCCMCGTRHLRVPTEPCDIDEQWLTAERERGVAL